MQKIRKKSMYSYTFDHITFSIPQNHNQMRIMQSILSDELYMIMLSILRKLEAFETF